jgi:hypothetical protein
MKRRMKDKDQITAEPRDNALRPWAKGGGVGKMTSGP